jgi:lysophospholipase L1-like esterase
MTSGRRVAAYGGGGILGASVGVAGMAGVLAVQARMARRWIGPMTSTAPPSSGTYNPRRSTPVGPPLRIALIGDSSAAGLGVEHSHQTPGALIATRIADTTQRTVRLRSTAVVGAQTSELQAQLDTLDDVPYDLTIIMIGANDVTHRVVPAESARLLEAAVTRVCASGSRVVVGTCPDLGTVRPIQHPLRLLCRHWSRSLANAQAQAVARAGGVAVHLGQVLGPEFDARPSELFADDGFHPSAVGYRAAVGVLLPAILLAVGVSERLAGRAGSDLLRDVIDLTDQEGTASADLTADDAVPVSLRR